MKNGIYKVEFKTLIGTGSGVIVLHDDKLHGGDAGMYYVGSYTEKDGKFSANVRIDRHTVVPGMGSVFGVNQANISLAGTINGDAANMTGTAKEAPDVTFQASLNFLSP